MYKILIVEDEKNIAMLIEDILKMGNYDCEHAYEGMSALDEIKNKKFDLIILDIMLPKLNGFELLEKIKNIDIPIIILSAKRDVESIIKGLKNGGEDYMTKPFEPLELLARVELRLKKIKKDYFYKDIKINTQKREVLKNETKIDLAPKEFELLILFLENLDKVITKDYLLKKVWNITVDIETRTVDYHIQQLRKKLDIKDSLITINRIGYCLEK